MDPQKVNGRPNPLIAQLRSDYAEAEIEIAQLREQLKIVSSKSSYIKKLLDSYEAPLFDGLYTGLTIAEVAIRILGVEEKPMSAIDIARRAMEGGFEAENIERARSHFSAVISKDINSEKPRFWQVDRGQIGLAEWQPQPIQTGSRMIVARLNSQPQPQQPAAKLPPPRQAPPPSAPPAKPTFNDDNAPFNDEQQFKEDDIPF